MTHFVRGFELDVEGYVNVGLEIDVYGIPDAVIVDCVGGYCWSDYRQPHVLLMSKTIQPQKFCAADSGRYIHHLVTVPSLNVLSGLLREMIAEFMSECGSPAEEKVLDRLIEDLMDEIMAAEAVDRVRARSGSIETASLN